MTEEKPKRKRGRPPKFDERGKQAACNAVRLGLGHETAAKVAGVTYRTFRNHVLSDPEFLQALERAEGEGSQAMAAMLWKSAKSGSVAAQIFWLKTRTKEFREVREVELRGPEATADAIRAALELTRNTVPRRPPRQSARPSQSQSQSQGKGTPDSEDGAAKAA